MTLELNKREITMYSKKYCSFCNKAQLFFEQKNIPFKYVCLDPKDYNYTHITNVLKTSTSQNTFPFIFIGTEFLGGFTELIHAYETLYLHILCSKIGIHVPFDL